jgi:hypothetical protein
VARLYANENFALSVVLVLRELGHDVLTTLDANKSNRRIPDPDVLKFACDEKRAVLTYNRRDFIRLHNQSAAHCGIIVCKYDSDFSGQATRIHNAILESADLTGKLLRVNRPAK